MPSAMGTADQRRNGSRLPPISDSFLNARASCLLDAGAQEALEARPPVVEHGGDAHAPVRSVGYTSSSARLPAATQRDANKSVSSTRWSAVPTVNSAGG